MPIDLETRITPAHIGGMLLEEAVLSLIQVCGYRPVNRNVNDPTVRVNNSGLRLRGRGTNHQIDAVADYVLPQPLTYPVRLLVEAKYYPTRSVGIEVVRNYVGVEKDLQEYWVPSGSHSTRPRHHYRSLIVTASNFTTPAQEYAYAHDISLLPLRRSRFFHPVLEAIGACCRVNMPSFPRRQNTARILGQPTIRRRQLNELRLAIRGELNARRNRQFDGWTDRGRTEYPPDTEELVATESFQRFIEETSRLNFALVATVGANIPIFLTPAPGVQSASLPNRQRVRIFWDNQGWYLRDEQGHSLFSFDLPEQLFNLYSNEGELAREEAINLKRDFFKSIKALVQTEGIVRMIEFELDQTWLDEIRLGFRSSRSDP